MMGYRRLEGEEAADLVLRVLREAGRPLTTREVQAEVEKRLGLVGRGLGPGDDPVAGLDELDPAPVIYPLHTAIDFFPQAMRIGIGLQAEQSLCVGEGGDEFAIGRMLASPLREEDQYLHPCLGATLSCSEDGLGILKAANDE